MVDRSAWPTMKTRASQWDLEAGCLLSNECLDECTSSNSLPVPR